LRDDTLLTEPLIDIAKKILKKMKILTLENCDNEYYIGYAEDDNNYMKFTITKAGSLTYSYTWKKKEFTDYEHFAGVIGKFNPHIFMLINPIVIDGPITFEAMREVELIIINRE